MTMTIHRTCVLAMLLSLPSLNAVAQDQAPTPVEPSSPPIAPAPAPTLAPTSDPVEIIRRAAAHDEENDKKGRNYTYAEKVLEQKLDGKGAVKSTETRGYDVMV